MFYLDISVCICYINVICENVKGLINCMCKEGFFGDGRDSCEGMCIRNLKKEIFFGYFMLCYCCFDC